MGAGYASGKFAIALCDQCGQRYKLLQLIKDWKGFKFAVPFEYSMHNFLLRYYVAEHGLDRQAIGLKGSTLFYRRRIEDMPLTEMPAGAAGLPERLPGLDGLRGLAAVTVVAWHLADATPGVPEPVRRAAAGVGALAVHLIDHHDGTVAALEGFTDNKLSGGTCCSDDCDVHFRPSVGWL